MSPDWQPSCSLATLRERARLMAKIRQFFTQRSYLEVETPIMAQHGITDLYLSNIEAHFRKQTYYLQTSPEYHMKRLLAAGSGPIFQLSKVFRDDELGRWHNPEFTMLEWYQTDMDLLGLIDEMEALLQLLLECPPLMRKSYQQVFIEICQCDPFNVSAKELKSIVNQWNLGNVLDADEADRDQYLFLLMSHVIEPALKEWPAPVAVSHFPPSQAALANISGGRAERVEIYYRGIELANGYHELTDFTLSQKRFEEDLSLRAQHNLSLPAIDFRLMAALQSGLPHSSGAALGVDRLIALALHKQRISEVLSFDVSRA